VLFPYWALVTPFSSGAQAPPGHPPVSGASEPLRPLARYALDPWPLPIPACPLLGQREPKGQCLPAAHAHSDCYVPRAAADTGNNKEVPDVSRRPARVLAIPLAARRPE